jgi:filamentous hemagglutinin family protein
LTINQTSPTAFITWKSFNIDAGETTTFIQPSSSSVVWNQINDANPSQILGNLNANGYVFLQNQNGFYVGGQASITAHGLIMTTAAIPAPDLSSGGPWSFNAPPPKAQIINYGQIKTTDGGSVFLIADDIENHGTISAPGGGIGLYAGQQVLVSTSPDGRGLSARVTLPQGSVDNQGHLIADAGKIALQAAVVNQGGLIQANSVRDVNGIIELVASDKVSLGASSVISAQGGTAGTSAGGSVTIKSDHSFSDQAGSTIDIRGGAQGGNGGQVSLCAPEMSSIQSGINGQAASGFVDGILTIDPLNIVLASSSSDPNAQYSGTVLPGDPPTADTLTLDVTAFSPTLSQINLAALNNITLNTVWTLNDPGVPATLTLTAGNNIIFNTGTGIKAGNNWSVNLTAGTGLPAGSMPSQGNDGIYLNGNSYLQGQNGNLTLSAANEVVVNSGSIVSQAGGNISVTTQYGNITLNSPWSENGAIAPATATLSLSAGNSIILNSSSYLQAVNDWNISLTAGTAYTGNTAPAEGSYGIYLFGSSYIQAQSGSINLWAANDVQVGWSGSYSTSANSGTGSITTMKGGSIGVTAEYGDVNTGGNYNGYKFAPNASTIHNNPPYYIVSPNLGGISTADGGNVTINAGNNVISFLPLGQNASAFNDGGTGAFGPLPGNVSINAGNNIYGHYVLADGTGSITAGGTIGVPVTARVQTDGFALSLVNGGWTVDAPNGSIYLQEVRNPNGVFNDHGGVSTYSGFHYFDYNPADSVTLDAANLVDITGYGLPRLLDALVPVLFPGTLTVNSGSGGFELASDVTLFPSATGNLSIDTKGGFFSYQTPATANNPNPPINTFSLVMSDSGSKQWNPSPANGVDGTFKTLDRAATPPQQNGQTPVAITVGTPVNKANMDNVTIYAIKAAQVMVYGNMNNSSFVGENLQSSGIMSKTTITVGGQIYYTPSLNSVSLEAAINSANPLQPGMWDSVFYLAITPGDETAVTSFDALNPNVIGANGLAYYLKSEGYLLFPNNSVPNAYGQNPGFYYNSDPKNLQLFFNGNMSAVLTPAQLTALEGGTFTVLRAGTTGQPLIDPTTGHLSTLSYTFIAPPSVAKAEISKLYNETLTVPSQLPPGFQIGGPGEFDITAASIELGNAPGVLSWGSGQSKSVDYSSLASLPSLQTPAGAAVNVTATDGDLTMLTSTIASFYGGDVTVNSVTGAINLGTQNIFITSLTPSVAYGIYTSGFSDVTVTAAKDIDVNGSRIATYAGGSLTVQSSSGNVNIGDGGSSYVTVPLVGPTGTSSAQIYGSGIVAVSLPPGSRPRGSPNRPGDITITTLQGNIVSTLAGILQIALDGNLAAGPKVTLIAGTTGVPATKNQGNIDLGDSGLIGGEVKLIATGDIQGYIISRQNASIHAGQNVNVTVLSTGTADVSAGGDVQGKIIGVGGADVSGSSVSASVLGQNVSVNGGAATSTLGATATATSASQSAAQQSSSETKQEVASDENDDQKNTKKGPAIRHVKRVTVLLPKPS